MAQRPQRRNRLALGVDEIVDLLGKPPRRLFRIAVSLGVGRTHNRLVFAEKTQLVGHFFGHEGHIGVQKPQCLVKNILENREGDRLVLGILGVFDVAAAKLIPDEVVNRQRAVLNAIAAENLIQPPTGLVRRHQNMLFIRRKISRRKRGEIRQIADGLGVHIKELCRVPDFGGEIATDLKLLFIDLRIAIERSDKRDRKPERVRRIHVDQFERIEGVAFRFGHLRAVGRADDAVDNDVLERRLLHKVDAGHHHARHPEEDDILRRHQI